MRKRIDESSKAEKILKILQDLELAKNVKITGDDTLRISGSRNWRAIKDTFREKNVGYKTEDDNGSRIVTILKVSESKLTEERVAEISGFIIYHVSDGNSDWYEVWRDGKQQGGQFEDEPAAKEYIQDYINAYTDSKKIRRITDKILEGFNIRSTLCERDYEATSDLHSNIYIFGEQTTPSDLMNFITQTAISNGNKIEGSWKKGKSESEKGYYRSKFIISNFKNRVYNSLSTEALDFYKENFKKQFGTWERLLPQLSIPVYIYVNLLDESECTLDFRIDDNSGMFNVNTQDWYFKNKESFLDSKENFTNFSEIKNFVKNLFSSPESVLENEFNASINSVEGAVDLINHYYDEQVKIDRKSGIYKSAIPLIKKKLSNFNIIGKYQSDYKIFLILSKTTPIIPKGLSNILSIFRPEGIPYWNTSNSLDSSIENMDKIMPDLWELRISFDKLSIGNYDADRLKSLGISEDLPNYLHKTGSWERYIKKLNAIGKETAGIKSIPKSLVPQFRNWWRGFCEGYLDAHPARDGFEKVTKSGVKATNYLLSLSNSFSGYDGGMRVSWCVEESEFEDYLEENGIDSTNDINLTVSDELITIEFIEITPEEFLEKVGH